MNNTRSCESCTACCDGWLRIEVRGHQIQPGNPCPFSVGQQCAIYEDRPHDPCRVFNCGWLIPTSPMPVWMRPDKSNVIFMPANFSWRGKWVDVAVAVGEHPKKKALDWLKHFAFEQKRLLMYQHDDDWFAFGPPAFQAEIKQQLSRGQKPWSNQSKNVLPR